MKRIILAMAFALGALAIPPSAAALPQCIDCTPPVYYCYEVCHTEKGNVLVCTIYCEPMN